MLKAGDRVKIRNDLKQLIGFDDMRQYAGKEAIIVFEDFYHKDWYEIDLDGGKWMWNEKMFEPVEIITKEEFEKFMRS